MNKLFTLLALSLTVVSCQSSGKTKPIDYRETPVPTDTSSCGLAEKHLQEMCLASPEENLYCCQASASTKKGKSFKQFCEETQNAGIALNPKCLSTITSCGQIDTCLGTVR